MIIPFSRSTPPTRRHVMPSVNAGVANRLESNNTPPGTNSPSTYTEYKGKRASFYFGTNLVPIWYKFFVFPVEKSYLTNLQEGTSVAHKVSLWCSCGQLSCTESFFYRRYIIPTTGYVKKLTDVNLFVHG